MQALVEVGSTNSFSIPNASRIACTIKHVAVPHADLCRAHLFPRQLLTLKQHAGSAVAHDLVAGQTPTYHFKCQDSRYPLG